MQLFFLVKSVAKNSSFQFLVSGFFFFFKLTDTRSERSQIRWLSHKKYLSTVTGPGSPSCLFVTAFNETK